MKGQLTPVVFDETIRVKKPEKLWGAPTIAAALGVSVDTVREFHQRGHVMSGPELAILLSIFFLTVLVLIALRRRR